MPPPWPGRKSRRNGRARARGCGRVFTTARQRPVVPIYITRVSSDLKIILKLFLTFVMFIKLFIYIKNIFKKLEHLDFSDKRATLHIH